MSERKYLQYPSTPIDWPASPRDLSGDSADFPYMGVYQAETTQRYTLGTRYTTWDGRVYKYGFAEAAVRSSMGCKCDHIQALGWASLAATSTVGSYTVSITTGATAQGTSAAGTSTSIFAKDGLAGGYVTLFDGGTTVSGGRGIVANDAVATGGGTLKLYLDCPINIELTTSDVAEVMPSPYNWQCYSQTYVGTGVMGIPVIAASANDFFWMQTWGPIWVTPQSAFGTNTSGTTHAYQGVFRHDGSVDMHNNASAAGGTTYNYHQQHAGFILSTGAEAGQGAPFMMLQISI